MVLIAMGCSARGLQQRLYVSIWRDAPRVWSLRAWLFGATLPRGILSLYMASMLLLLVRPKALAAFI